MFSLRLVLLLVVIVFVVVVSSMYIVTVLGALACREAYGWAEAVFPLGAGVSPLAFALSLGT